MVNKIRSAFLYIKQEKRSSPRIGIKLPLRCQIRGSKEFNNGVTYDISKSGLSFINDKFIAPNTFVNLEINVLATIVNAIGKIVSSNSISRSNKYRLGIEFQELNQNYEFYLSDYINMRIENSLI